MRTTAAPQDDDTAQDEGARRSAAPRPGRGGHRARAVAAPLAVGLGLAVLLGACTQQPGQDASGDVLDGSTVGGSDAEAEQQDPDAEPEPAAGGGYAYDDVFDDGFYDAREDYRDAGVRLTAEVGEVVTQATFTLTGADEGPEEILVVSSRDAVAVEEDLPVEVTGVLTEDFDVTTAEEYLGTDLQDDRYAAWEGQDYVLASEVVADR